MCTGSPCKCPSWRQLRCRLCLCQGAPALRDPTINKPVCAAEPTLLGTGRSQQDRARRGGSRSRSARIRQRDGSWVAESPGAMRVPVPSCGHGTAPQARCPLSITVCSLAGGTPGPPFPCSLPPRRRQELARDSRRAPGLGQAGSPHGEPPGPEPPSTAPGPCQRPPCRTR